MNWIRLYGTGYIVLALLFIVSSVSGSMLLSSLHLCYGTVYCFYIVYYELFVRLNVPRPKTAIPEVALMADDLPAVPASVNDELWETLTARMQAEKLWRKDMSLAELAELLDTNRTTLASLFKAKGYEGGYREYVNRYRIIDFLDIMAQSPRHSMQEAFFIVGYRSRMTAFRNFKEYAGKSPSEYFTNQPEE